jgi:decaprenylphospho-beta-D-erythro-pentofuranosid-2-ulose 2-reductase
MKAVLILGATSHVAADVARVYAARSARLYLVGRNSEKLRALCVELGAAVVGSEAIDFARYEGNAGCIARAVTALGRIDVALIAHGELGDQLQSEREFAEAERIIAINFTSAVSLIVPLANQLETQGTGCLAVISSVAGERGRPRNYSYGAAKGALTLYLQGVRSRLWPAVSVVTIKLGPVHSPMTADHPKNALFADSPAAARSIVAAIDRRRGEVFVPWYWRPIMSVVVLLPEAIFQRFGFLAGR